MDMSRTFTLMVRWMIFTAALAGLFWAVWALTGTPIPSAEPFRLLDGSLPWIDIFASRLWDPIGLAFLVGFDIFFEGWLRPKLKSLQADLCDVPYMSACFGLTIGSGLFSVWIHPSMVAWSEDVGIPAGFLILSAACGFVVGLTRLFGGIKVTRGALMLACLIPFIFAMASALCSGVIMGFMHALIIAGSLGLIGSVLSATVFLLAYAVLKSRFWTLLGRWLILRKADPDVEEVPEPDDLWEWLRARFSRSSRPDATLPSAQARFRSSARVP